MKAMTEKERHDVRAYSAFLLKEYGYQVPPLDPLMPALYVIHREMQVNNKTNEAIGLTLKEALSKVNPQTFNFNHSGEAWKYQLGITVRWVVVIVLIALCSSGAGWFWSLHNKEIDEARKIINEYEPISMLFKRAELDAHGRYFIDFVSTNSDQPNPLLEYRRVNKNTVRIYLTGKK